MLVSFVYTLAQLQQTRISHRDIKPENILKLGKKYKITDFGLAMLYDNGPFADYAGSPDYVSPLLKECFITKFKKFNYHNIYKSDVYSLGMTLIYAAAVL